MKQRAFEQPLFSPVSGKAEVAAGPEGYQQSRDCTMNCGDPAGRDCFVEQFSLAMSCPCHCIQAKAERIIKATGLHGEVHKAMYSCEYCRDFLDQGEAITVVRDNRLYLFCCKKCKDEWSCIIDPDNQLRFF